MGYVTRRQRAENRRKKIKIIVVAIIAVAVICIAAYCVFKFRTAYGKKKYRDGLNIPAYSGVPYTAINDNKPFFSASDYSTISFEEYSGLDDLGRCGPAFANVGRDIMPTEERGEIGSIKPTGWIQRKYKGIIPSNPPYLYNRCHLIAYCLTAENANERNLITGTRYMNIEGMLPFEEKVAEYLDENDNHVLYRATPVFDGNNLVADGVLIEALSVEDDGAGICFCVFCYNVQPGIEIDYKTGESKAQSK